MFNQLIDKLTYRVPVSFYKRIIPRNVVGIFYHTISDEPLPHIQSIYECKSQAMFERDLVFIKNNYHPVSYQQVYDHVTRKVELKPNAIFISFDDGFRECFSIARPLLKKYGIPCTFFITTDFIDNHVLFYRHKVSLCIFVIKNAGQTLQDKIFSWIQKNYHTSILHLHEFEQWIDSLKAENEDIIDNICIMLGIDIQDILKTQIPYMTRDEIQTLASEGFTIGAHSKSHRLLSQLTYDELEQEIVGSCRVIQEITQAQSIPFAFPFFGHQIDKGLLKKIQTRNCEVGQFFDSNGIRESSGLIFDRIWADAPEWNHDGISNVQSLIMLAYRDILLDRLRNVGLYR